MVTSLSRGSAAISLPFGVCDSGVSQYLPNFTEQYRISRGYVVVLASHSCQLPWYALNAPLATAHPLCYAGALRVE